MPAPSPLAIATASVSRLVKEKTYYHEELASQQKRVDKLEKKMSESSADSLDENAEYTLNQEKRAVEETRTVIGPLRDRIAEAMAKLEEQIALSSDDAPSEELAKAKEMLQKGQDALKSGTS